jgi:hypothetical protein
MAFLCLLHFRNFQFYHFGFPPLPVEVFLIWKSLEFVLEAFWVQQNRAAQALCTTLRLQMV